MKALRLLRVWLRCSPLPLILVTLLATVLPSVRSAAADYRAPGLSTPLVNPPELALEAIRILSEFPLPNGQVLLEVDAQVRNLADQEWEGVYVRRVTNSTMSGATTLPGLLSFPDPSLPGTLLTTSNSVATVTDAATVAAARAEILSGSVLRVLARGPDGTAGALPTNLVVEGLRIVSEVPLGTDRVLLHFAGDIRNVGSVAWTNVTLNLDSALSTAGLRPAPGSLAFASQLPAFGLLTGAPPLMLSVDAAAVSTVRSNLLSGVGLQIHGSEMWVFAARPLGIDAATEDAFRPPVESAGEGRITLVFTNTTSYLEGLVPGDLMLENPSLHRLIAHVPHDPLDPFSEYEPPLARYLPLEVASVSIQTNEVRVVGTTKAVLSVLKSGTLVATHLDSFDRPVRDPYNPTLEVTHTSEEKADRDDAAIEIGREDPRDGRLADLKGMNALPFHFNESLLDGRVTVSGELLFRQSGLQLEFKIRNFQVQRATTRVDAGAVLNLVLEGHLRGGEGGEEEGDGEGEEEPSDGEPKNLMPPVPLPPVTFNIGGVPVTIQPEIALTAFAQANIPTSLTIPLQSSFILGMEMGFDRSLINSTNDGYFYRPITEFIPLRVSDPTVFDEFAATLEAWVELSLAVKLGIGEGLSLKTGPAIGVRLGGDFTLAPLSDPWWEMNAGVDLIGRFTMDLEFLEKGLSLIDAEGSLHRYDLFHRDAGGPLIGGGSRSARAEVTTPGGLQPLVGKEVRWARTFQPPMWFQYRNGFVGPLHDGSGDFLAAGSGGISHHVSTLARFTRTGDLVWLKDNRPIGGPVLQESFLLPDDTLFGAGSSGRGFAISTFTADGDREWAHFYQGSQPIVLTAATGRILPGGEREYFVGGYLNDGIVTRSDVYLAKFDQAGQLVWSYLYPLDEDDQVHGLMIDSTGHLIVVGETGADVAPPTTGSPDPGNVLKYVSSAGLLMKVNAATGDLVWATACPAQWGILFLRAIELPDGSLVAAGAAPRIVTQNRPSNIFARFTADGVLLDHVLIGEDPDVPDELPNGGSTAYDAVTGLQWTPEGIVACGTTGLGTGTAGWVLGLTEEFGVRFFSVVDGPRSEALLDLADAGDGLVVLGNTWSADQLGRPNEGSPFVMKLPWEGILRFHESSTLQTRFLRPRVYHSSVQDEYRIRASAPGANGTMLVFGNNHGPVTFGRRDVALAAGPPLAPFNATSNAVFFQLEWVPSSAVTNLATWRAYYQVPADSDWNEDLDGDGLSNLAESFFGTSPRNSDPGDGVALAPAIPPAADLVLSFERSILARTLSFTIESSPDLVAWTAETGAAPLVEPIDTTRERVVVRLPRTPGGAFFRVRIEEPPVGAGRR